MASKLSKRNPFAGRSDDELRDMLSIGLDIDAVEKASKASDPSGNERKAWKRGLEKDKQAVRDELERRQALG